MKNKLLSLTVLAFVVGGSTGLGDTYRVTVTRKDSNLYRIDGSKLFIKTKYCYEYAISEDAILRYDKYAYDNKLIFDKRSLVASCDVDKLLSED